MVEVWSVHATEDACDLAMRAPGAGRVASDEVVVRGVIAEDLRDAIRRVDRAALIREATEGWAEVAIKGSESRDQFARISALRLPDGRGYVQGDVARVRARVFVDDDEIRVLVPAHWESHLRQRLEAEPGR